MKKKLFIGLVVLIVGIQLIPVKENNGPADTPSDITHYVQVPQNVLHTLKRSCYDCHSNHTNYPWYAQINPVGLWLNYHVNEGKSELNFSDVSTYDKKKLDHKLEEIAQQVSEQEMPLSSYTLIHKEAKLSEEQIKIIEEWIKKNGNA